MRKTTGLSALLVYLLALSLGIALCSAESYALAFREQQQLFLWNAGYISESLFAVGGFARLTALFIVQFFYCRPLAVLLCASLCAGIPALLHCSIVPARPASWLCSLLTIAPILALIGLNSLHFQYFTALFLVAAALCAFSRIRSGQLPASFVLTALLYLLAGPAALLFALMLPAAAISRRESVLPALVATATSLLLPLLPFLTGSTAQPELLPSFYYEPTGGMPPFIILCHFSIPLLYSAAALLANARGRTTVTLCTAACLLASVCLYVCRPRESEQQRDIYRYEYNLVHNRPGEVEKLASSKMYRYIDANYRNLASASQGRLLEDLFKARQHSPMTLFYCPEDHSAGLYLARALFEAGDFAAAQSVAFNALPVQGGYSPSMLGMLAYIELLRGNRAVASRYIDMLASTVFYRDDARGLRALMQDAAGERFENDRRNFDCPETFVLNPVPYGEIISLAESNPQNDKTVEYALATMLLSKDFNGIYRFVAAHPRSPGTVLAVPVQEALVFFSDYYSSTSKEYALAHGLSEEQYAEYSGIDREWCRGHGVSDEVFQRFARFKDAYSRSGGAPVSGFETSFWHYLLFVKL